MEELLAHYPGRLHLIPQRATVFLFLNTRSAPFDDIRVRRALNYAVDRQKVADLHGGPAVAEPTCQIVAPTVPGYRRFCPYTIEPDSSGDWKAPDLAKARALIAASGTKGRTDHRLDVVPVLREGEPLPRLAPPQARLSPAASERLPIRAPTASPSTGHRAFRRGSSAGSATLVAADIFSTLSCGYVSNWAHFCDRRVDAQVKRLAAEQARDPTAGRRSPKGSTANSTPRLHGCRSSHRGSPTSSPAASGTTSQTPTPQAQSCSISSGFADSFRLLPRNRRAEHRRTALTAGKRPLPVDKLGVTGPA